MPIDVDLVRIKAPGDDVPDATTELVELHQAAEKARTIGWADEPVACLEDAVVALGQTRAVLDAVEVEIFGVYDASKEWKATGALSAATRIAHLTGARVENVRWRVGLARKLRSMPHTVAAFERGEITIDHVGVLCRANLIALEAEFARDEETLVDKARTLPYDEFFTEVRQWRDIVDPEGAEKRALSNFEERRVHASATFEGMGRLDGWMDPIGFHEFDTELDRHYQRLLEADWAEARERLGDAATVHDLGRTAAQRRHDALVEMARASAEHGGAGTAPTLRTTVVVDHATYLVALARILASCAARTRTSTGTRSNGAASSPTARPSRPSRRCGPRSPAGWPCSRWPRTDTPSTTPAIVGSSPVPSATPRCSPSPPAETGRVASGRSTARSTTSSNGSRAAPPTRPTVDRCARATTCGRSTSGSRPAGAPAAAAGEPSPDRTDRHPPHQPDRHLRQGRARPPLRFSLSRVRRGWRDRGVGGGRRGPSRGR